MTEPRAHASLAEGKSERAAYWPICLEFSGQLTEIEQERERETAERGDAQGHSDYPETLYLHEQADFKTMIPLETRELVERIESKLGDDRLESEQDGDLPPNPAAVGVCLKLAKRLAPHLALAPQLKWSAFTEDDGGISLVFQSLITDRRVNCRVSANGSKVTGIRIDEHMQPDSFEIRVDTDMPRELAGWVVTRS